MPIKTADDVKNLGSIMCVFAHPDDETFTAAGLLIAAIINGQQVVCVTATKGEAGVQDEAKWPKESLGEVRQKELEQAFEILGITNHHWLDYKDGQCVTSDKEHAVSRVAELIEKYQPDTVLTFGQDGLTGHDDHKTVGEWAKQACGICTKKPAVYCVVQPKELYEKYLKTIDEKFNFFFNIDEPQVASQSECDVYFALNDEQKSQKYQALKDMPSQTQKLLNAYEPEFIQNAFGVEAFVRVK